MSIPPNPNEESMKAVCFTSFGPNSDSLSVTTIPKPFIEVPNEVLIKVHACALNPIDKLRLSGSISALFPEPYDTNVLGYDVSGVVAEVGQESSKSFQVGDEVYVRLNGMKYGALAEYVVCAVPDIAKKPSNLSFSEAAAIPLAGLTALQALRRGGVKEGSKVFILAGAGGVGSLAIQIAKKMLKASHVCTTASPGLGTDICTKAGADQIIDYRSQDFQTVLKDGEFDMVFDTQNQAHLMGGIIKKGSKVISIAGTPTIEAIEAIGMKPSFVVRTFMFLGRNRKAERAVTKAGGSWEYLFMQPSGENLSEIAKFLENGDINAIIDTEASSLEDFKTAVDKLWSGRTKGKCVIKVVP